MGMFDDIKCKYPLPVEGANALDYQTKDTDAQQPDNLISLLGVHAEGV